MVRKLLLSITILIFFFTALSVEAGSLPMPGRACEGSQMPDGTFISAGQVREIVYGGVRYRCVGCGGCTPIGGSSSSTIQPSVPYIQPYGSTSQQITIGIMGAFLSGFFSNLFSGAFDFTQTNYSTASLEKKRIIEEERKKEEERKRQLLSQYNSLIAQAKKTVHTPDNQGKSSLSFQSLSGSLEPFKWQSYSPSIENNRFKEQDSLFTLTDLNRIFGNIIQDKIIENIEERVENYGGKLIERIDKKYGKDWASKYYDRGLPLMKITVTAYNEGIERATPELIDYAVSLIPVPSFIHEVSEFGRKVYTKVAFRALDKFLTESEKACEFFQLNCSKEEFWRKAEDDMNTAQRIIYNWLGGKVE